MTDADSLDGLTDAALYAREFELRQILDREKTEEQLAEVNRLKAEIRKRFPLSPSPSD